MHDNGPPLEVEVVAMGPPEGSDVANLADHALLESIQRLKKYLSSEIRSRLSDGGAKLKALLCQMDAERNRRDRVRDPETRYLKEEWSYMNQNSPPQDVPFTDKIWKNFSRRIDYKTITVPQQNNEYDCGLFVLYFMKKFIEDTSERFRRKYLSMFGSKWFKSEEASGLRKRIQGLVLEVFGSAMTEKDKAESACYHESPEDDCLQ